MLIFHQHFHMQLLVMRLRRRAPIWRENIPKTLRVRRAQLLLITRNLRGFRMQNFVFRSQQTQSQKSLITNACWTHENLPISIIDDEEWLGSVQLYGAQYCVHNSTRNAMRVMHETSANGIGCRLKERKRSERKNTIRASSYSFSFSLASSHYAFRKR